jgi:hypothetical protein
MLRTGSLVARGGISLLYWNIACAAVANTFVWKQLPVYLPEQDTSKKNTIFEIKYQFIQMKKLST